MTSLLTWTISIIDVMLIALLILMVLSKRWSPDIRVPRDLPLYVNRAPYLQRSKYGKR